jgi:hypothetical protein
MAAMRAYGSNNRGVVKLLSLFVAEKQMQFRPQISIHVFIDAVARLIHQSPHSKPHLQLAIQLKNAAEIHPRMEHPVRGWYLTVDAML